MLAVVSICSLLVLSGFTFSFCNMSRILESNSVWRISIADGAAPLIYVTAQPQRNMQWAQCCRYVVLHGPWPGVLQLEDIWAHESGPSCRTVLQVSSISAILLWGSLRHRLAKPALAQPAMAASRQKLGLSWLPSHGLGTTWHKSMLCHWGSSATFPTENYIFINGDKYK